MAAKVVTFDNFSAGEYGLLGYHAPAHSFTGSNVVILPNGSVAPRSGLVDFGVTGASTGTVLGFGYNAARQRAWFIQSTATRDFDSDDVGSVVRTLTGSLASTPTARVRSVNAENDNQTFIANYGDKGYYLDHATGALTALATSPAGRAIGVYNDRLLIAGTAANSNRLSYSKGGDFTDWSGTGTSPSGFLDIGYGYDIVLVAAHRDRVTIAKSDGTWWILTGTPGVNDVLRRILRGPRPGSSVNGMTRWGITGDGQLWFLPEWGEFPVSFNGATVQALEHLALKANPSDPYADVSSVPSLGVTGLHLPSDLFFCTGQSDTAADDNQGLLFHRGIWTKHAFTKDISGYVDGRFDLTRRILFCDGGALAAAPKFYTWSYALNRPPFAGETWESLGDASSTPVAASFTTPEWWSHDGSEVQAQTVIVDFKKWNHGFSVDNGFTVTLTPLRRDGGSVALAGGDGTAVSVGTFDESRTSASTSGTTDRRRWSVPTSTSFANGFKVQVSAMVGVAIEKIHVVMDQRPMQAV